MNAQLAANTTGMVKATGAIPRATATTPTTKARATTVVENEPAQAPVVVQEPPAVAHDLFNDFDDIDSI